MIFQDANQVNTYWCFGRPPAPKYINTAGGGYWQRWILAPITA